MYRTTRRGILVGITSTSMMAILAACSSGAPSAAAPTAPAASGATGSAAPTVAAAQQAAAPATAATNPQKAGGKFVVWDASGAAYQKNLTNASPSTRAQAQWYEWQVKTFAAQNSGAQISFEDHGWDVPLVNSLTAAIAAGNPPEVTDGEAFVHVFVTLGAFAQVDTREKFVPATILGAQENGKTYGIPAFTSPFVLESNRTVIKQAGLDPDKPPKTWDELISNSTMIAKAGAQKYYGFSLYGPAPSRTYGTALRTMPWIDETGGYLGDDAGTKATFNDPKSVAAYELCQKLLATGSEGNAFANDEGKLYSFLWQNKAAYQLSAIWNVYNAQEAKADTLYSGIPVMQDGGPSGNVVLGNTTYSPLKKGKNLDLGLAYVNFLGAAENQWQVANILGQRLPTNLTVLQDPKLLSAPLYKDIGDTVKVFIDALTAENVHPVPPFPKNGVKIWAAWTTGYGKILKEKQSPSQIQATINGVQSQIEGLLS